MQMINNPWKKKKSKVKYKDKRIKFHRDKVIRPDGKKDRYSYLETKGGVGVVAINDIGKIYLVGQYRYAPDVYSLEIPKGAFDSFDSLETPLEAVKRELKEETGLTAEKWNPLGTVHTLMGYSNDIVYLFLAKELTLGESNPDSCEKISIFEKSFNDIIKIIKEGIIIDNKKITISDATTIAAIYLARDQLIKSPD